MNKSCIKAELKETVSKRDGGHAVWGRRVRVDKDYPINEEPGGESGHGPYFKGAK